MYKIHKIQQENAMNHDSQDLTAKISKYRMQM